MNVGLIRLMMNMTISHSFRVTYLQKDGFDCNTVTVEAVSSVEAEQKVKQMPDCDAVLAIMKK